MRCILCAASNKQRFETRSPYSRIGLTATKRSAFQISDHDLGTLHRSLCIDHFA
jgi:hypothetical protein